MKCQVLKLKCLKLGLKYQMYDSNSPFLKSGGRHQSRPKSDQAEVQLREAILWCGLAPGTTATEAELADRFGLGRAATRVALAKLSAMGFVHAIPRSGWQILPISGAHIGEVVGALEFAEQALASCVLGVDDVARLKELVEVLQSLAGRSEPAARLSRLEYEREMREIVASKINPYVAAHLSFLWDCADRIVRFLEGRCDARLPARDSRGFSDAVIKGDHVALRRVVASDLFALRELAMSAFLQDQTELARPRTMVEGSARFESDQQGSSEEVRRNYDVGATHDSKAKDEVINQGEKPK
jgi:DNA-binding GntR family transcriptional regulator